MYDSHIFYREYKDLKDQIVDIVNGDTADYDIEALAEHIQELYGEYPKVCVNLQTDVR